jgi:hypothetical protein
MLCPIRAQLELIGLEPLHACMLALVYRTGERYWAREMPCFHDRMCVWSLSPSVIATRSTLQPSTLRQTSSPPSDAFEANTRETESDPTYLLPRASADSLGVLVRELPKDPDSGGCVGIEPPRRRAIHLRPEGRSFPRILVNQGQLDCARSCATIVYRTLTPQGPFVRPGRGRMPLQSSVPSACNASVITE